MMEAIVGINILAIVFLVLAVKRKFWLPVVLLGIGLTISVPLFVADVIFNSGVMLAGITWLITTLLIAVPLFMAGVWTFVGKYAKEKRVLKESLPADGGESPLKEKVDMLKWISFSISVLTSGLTIAFLYFLVSISHSFDGYVSWTAWYVLISIFILLHIIILLIRFGKHSGVKIALQYGLLISFILVSALMESDAKHKEWVLLAEEINQH